MQNEFITQRFDISSIFEKEFCCRVTKGRREMKDLLVILDQRYLFVYLLP